ATFCSERACSPSAPAMPGDSFARAGWLRHQTCRCISSFSAPTRPVPPFTPFPALSHRSVNYGPRAAVSCASNRLTPPSRRRSSRTERDTVVAGLKLLRRIMGQPAMRRYVAEERAPGPRCTSDADLLAFAREAGTTVFHPTSTCRMGGDPTAVVDERLRVHGIDRLRVVDGSIMPTLVSGNTNAAIVMIAEKGADIILQDAFAEAPVGISASTS